MSETDPMLDPAMLGPALPGLQTVRVRVPEGVSLEQAILGLEEAQRVVDRTFDRETRERLVETEVEALRQAGLVKGYQLVPEATLQQARRDAERRLQDEHQAAAHRVRDFSQWAAVLLERQIAEEVKIPTHRDQAKGNVTGYVADLLEESLARDILRGRSLREVARWYAEGDGAEDGRANRALLRMVEAGEGPPAQGEADVEALTALQAAITRRKLARLSEGTRRAWTVYRSLTSGSAATKQALVGGGLAR